MFCIVLKLDFPTICLIIELGHHTSQVPIIFAADLFSLSNN